jgi:hypothetical protein
VWVTDLNSLGGTFLNHQRLLCPALVKLCDTIQAGGNQLAVLPLMEIAPACLQWNDGTVTRLAQAIYSEERFTDLPILADALLDAGCDNDDLMQHCRAPGVHETGCWALDLLLGTSIP